jgi:hypothetical protein
MDEKLESMLKRVKDFSETAQELEHSYLAHNDAFKGRMVILLARMNVDMISFLKAMLKDDLSEAEKIAFKMFEMQWNRNLERLIVGLSFAPDNTPDNTPIDRKFVDRAVVFMNTICDKAPV